MKRQKHWLDSWTARQVNKHPIPNPSLVPFEVIRHGKQETMLLKPEQITSLFKTRMLRTPRLDLIKYQDYNLKRPR